MSHNVCVQSLNSNRGFGSPSKSSQLTRVTVNRLCNHWLIFPDQLNRQSVKPAPCVFARQSELLAPVGGKKTTLGNILGQQQETYTWCVIYSSFLCDKIKICHLDWFLMDIKDAQLLYLIKDGPVCVAFHLRVGSSSTAAFLKKWTKWKWWWLEKEKTIFIYKKLLTAW